MTPERKGQLKRAFQESPPRCHVDRDPVTSLPANVLGGALVGTSVGVIVFYDGKK